MESNDRNKPGHLLTRENLELVLQSAQVETWQWEIATNDVRWSDGIESMLGLEPGSFDGTFSGYLDLVHPDDRDAVIDTINQTLESGRVYHVEHRMIIGDDQTCWMEARGEVLRDEQGQPTGMVGIVMNITERKLAEQALCEANQRTASILDSISDGFFVLDRDFVLTYFNPAAEKLLGRNAEDVLGCKLFDAFPEARGSIFEQQYSWVLHNQRPVYFEIYFGVEPYENWYEVRAYPLEGGISVYFQVTTKRKQAEEELQRLLGTANQSTAETEALLTAARAVLENRDFEEAAQVIFDTCNTLIGSTSGYVALLAEDGQENDVLFLDSGGLPCTVDPELPMPIRGLRAEAYHTRRAVYDNKFTTSEWMKFMPEGHVALENVLFAPLIIGGEGQGLLGVANKPGGFDDNDARMATAFGELAAIALKNSRTLEALEKSEKMLTEHSHLLEDTVDKRTRALQDAQEQLLRQEKLAALGQLAGGVGHELRNPLGVISNAVFYLNTVFAGVPETKNHPDVNEYLDMISEEVHNADRIVHDLLDFGRIRPADRLPVHVSELVQRVMVKHQPPEDVEARIELPTGLPDVLVDPLQMEQVLANLVDNAYQAMPEGGTLSISAEAGEDQLALLVTDTGSGISQENMQKIFEPLFTTKVRGIGLGLALSRSLVEANDGSISVESKSGQGSTFTLTLPIAAP